MYRTSGLALFAALLLSALSGLVLGFPHFASAAQVNVSMMDSFFAAKNVTIAAGDTVVWRNNGSMMHNVTADNGSFKSGDMPSGTTFSQLFTTPGTYPYYCSLHGAANGQGMSGTITVTQPQAPVPTTQQSTGSSIPSGSVATSLAAQAQALLARVMQLQQQLGGVFVSGGTLIPAGSTGTNVVSSANCPRVGVTLRPGSSGDDVSRLQRYLAQDSSVYPEATVSGYYGPLTQRAVERWQIKYNIVSAGSPGSTGFGQVGPRTAVAIALQCSTISGQGGVGASQQPAQTSTVGGFMEVMPTSGNAPLNVSVKATVNTVKSCGATVYMLDWGDGSAPQPIAVSANMCDQVAQTYPHIYQFGGAFSITLSAGAHKTSATVVVAGPAAPPPEKEVKLPTQTFKASQASGAGPLRVTFSGVVTSANAAWCDTGCSNTLDFGDGTADTVSLPEAKNASQTYSIQHTYTNSGSFRAILYQGESTPGVPIVGSPITITVNGAGGGGGVDTYGYGPLGVTPGVNGNPLGVAATFDIPSSCTGYRLSWGDGTSDVTQNHSTGCSQGAVTRSFTHQYSAAGSYDIVLQRGSNLSRQDTAAVVISN